MARQVPDTRQIRGVAVELILETLKEKKSPARPQDVKEGVSLTRDLGIDSLDILQMTAVLEKKYRLRIPDEESKNLDDLGGIVKAVAKHWPA